MTGPHGPREALAVKMHGWRRGVKRGDASLQVFWVFHEAGVKKVLADGGVGSLNHLLDPRDIVVPNDFIDLTVKQDIYVRGDHLLIMREPICPISRASVRRRHESFARVFRRGTYLVTDGPRFESVAEVDYMKRLGGDVIGQSLAPEVFLARDIGACYAGIYIVVNYGEGVVREWEHAELKAVFFDESETIARIVLDAVADATSTPRHAAARSTASRACSACLTSESRRAVAASRPTGSCRSPAPRSATALSSCRRHDRGGRTAA